MTPNMLLGKFYYILILIIIMSTITYQAGNDEQSVLRTKRGFNPWGFFQTLGEMKRIVVQQYNDTVSSLNQVYDIVSNGFSDTATKTPQPKMEVTTNAPNSSTTTTTEKYRLTRAEFGRILGRNYRGLNRLLQIELNDAKNQSKYNIQNYEREIKNAIAPYAVFKNTSKT